MPGSRLLLVFALVAAAPLVSCGDDPGLPDAEHAVQVRTDSFFPSTLEVVAGDRVRWENTQRRGTDSRRTVTSGGGPEDAQAGVLFDAEIDGYGSGDRYGETFVYRFEEPGTYPYFTRLPAGHTYAGTVIVH